METRTFLITATAVATEMTIKPVRADGLSLGDLLSRQLGQGA